MRTMILVVSAILSSWAGTARAADLFDTPMELKLSSPFAETSRSAPRLLEANAPFRLLAEGSPASGGAQMDSGARSIIALALSFFVGFGTGHFVLGDGSAVLFLGLDIVLIATAIGVYVAAVAAIANGVVPAFIFIAPLALLVYSGVRIWELVDCIFKSGVIGGSKSSAAILPHGPEVARATAFQVMAANGPAWRF